jgi:hypothetical protein
VLLSLPATIVFTDIGFLNINSLNEQQQNKKIVVLTQSNSFFAIVAGQNIKIPLPTISVGISFAQQCPNKAIFYHNILTQSNALWRKIRYNNFTANDLVQAHYYIFALRKILI